MQVKQLPKMTPCNLIKIRTPLWNGGQRKVGIATFKIGTHNEIRIEAKNKEGDLIYPQPFYITGEKARSYPQSAIPNHPHIKTYEIPIEDLDILERI